MQVHGTAPAIHLPRADRGVCYQSYVRSRCCCAVAVAGFVEDAAYWGQHACCCGAHPAPVHRWPPSMQPPKGMPLPCGCRCQQLGFSGECCPRTAAGGFMPCCAKAKAHPECPADQYLSPEDAICPARTGKFLAVSHNAVGSCDRGSLCQHEHVDPHKAPWHVGRASAS